ncbi:MAG: hypothetical protein SFV22_19375, partial [Saprospiraceae bacterium]|nr:hypothetical protein [Saprospiraceae bacterium]
WQPNNRHTVRFGGYITYHDFLSARLQAGSDDGRVRFEAGREYDGWEFGAYIADEWAFDKLKLNYGFRLSGWRNNPATYVNPEPRVAANYELNKRLSFKASYARMNQYVHLLASSGLSLPTDIWYPSTEGVKPEISDQIAIGTSYLLGDQVLVTWEAWYKWLQNSIDFKDGAELFGNNELEQELSIGRGYAYSPLELEIEKKEGRLTGWIGYTLSWVRRGDFPEIENGAWFAPRFDTRHNLSVVALWDAHRWKKRGKDKSLQVTATWVYTSGYPAWLPEGRAYFSDFPGSPAIPSVPVYGRRNSFRYPAYMRADLGIVYKWKKRNGFEQDLTLSVYNATDRRNPYFITIAVETQDTPVGEVPLAITARQISLFPILPSLTWNFKF